MTLYDDAVGLMNEIQEQTKDMRTGVLPDIYMMLELQGRLVSIYHQIGEELARQFTSKEARYLDRKVAAAKYHLRGRIELKMTQEDAKQDSVKKTEEEYRTEIEAMSTYEHLKILRDSVGRAFDYCQQVISTIKWAEGKMSA